MVIGFEKSFNSNPIGHCVDELFPVWATNPRKKFKVLNMQKAAWHLRLACQSWQIPLWKLSNQIIRPSLAWQPCPLDLQNFEDVIFHLDSIETKILLFFHILFCCLVSLPGMVITDAAALKITQIAARNGKWGSVPLSNRSLMVLVMVWCLKRLVRSVNKTINRHWSLLNLWWPRNYFLRLKSSHKKKTSCRVLVARG